MCEALLMYEALKYTDWVAEVSFKSKCFYACVSRLYSLRLDLLRLFFSFCGGCYQAVSFGSCMRVKALVRLEL